MAGILIKNGRIWDGEQFAFGDVFIRDGIIERIAPQIREKADFSFDATDMLVTPGLVDAHIHIQGPEPDPYGINAEMCTIPFGATAAADAGGAHGDKTFAQAHLLKNVTFVTVPIRNNLPVFTRTEEKLRAYGDNAIGLKVYFDDENPQILDISPLQTICAYARERGLKVMVHCTDSPTPMAQILETLAPGDILTHAFHGGRSTAAEDDFASMIAAQKRGIVIDTGFAGNVHTDFEIFRAAIAKGILPDTISTDITRASAYKRGGRYGLTMAMSMARTAGMEEADILRAVTVNPAKALGKAGAWGCLREGGCADVAVLCYTDEGFDLTDRAGNRLVSDQGYRCKLTVANGDVVYRH